MCVYVARCVFLSLQEVVEAVAGVASSVMKRGTWHGIVQILKARGVVVRFHYFVWFYP